MQSSNPFSAVIAKLFAQEPLLIEAAVRIAETVGREPQDQRYPSVPPRAFVVGGFVRDALLGLRSTDLDMEVAGVAPERLELLLDSLFPRRVNTVGKAFCTYKIALPDGFELDVSLPRKESKTAKGHKGFAVSGEPGLDVADALHRRDFTINSMAIDPLTGELQDPFNGEDDLKNRILRATDPATFGDDPLRVYRALQFAARFTLTIETSTIELLRTMVARGDTEELAPERIAEEIKKLLLRAEHPSIGLERMRDIGLVERSFPELAVLIGVGQEPEWHPEGDVWTHTLMVVDQAAAIIRRPDSAFTPHERLVIMLGALCHDLGKPETTAAIDGRIRTKGHATSGQDPTKRLCARFGIPESMAREIIRIVAEHMQPIALLKAKLAGTLDDAQYANAIRKTLKRIHPVPWPVLLAVSEADFRGRGFEDAETKPYDAGRLFAETVQTNGLDAEPTKPLLQGRDLLELGVTPGPDMGEVIATVEKSRDAGEITTRAEALDAARTILSSRP